MPEPRKVELYLHLPILSSLSKLMGSSKFAFAIFMYRLDDWII
jgi:hypothetical protein